MSLDGKTLKAIEDLAAIVERDVRITDIDESFLSELISVLGGVDAVFLTLKLAQNDDPEMEIIRLVRQYVPADALHYLGIRKDSGGFFWSAAAGIGDTEIPPSISITRLSSSASNMKFPLPSEFLKAVLREGETKLGIVAESGLCIPVDPALLHVVGDQLLVQEIDDFFGMPSAFGTGSDAWQILRPLGGNALGMETPIIALGPAPARLVSGNTTGAMLRSGFVWESAAMISSTQDEHVGLLHSQFLVAKSVTLYDELGSKLRRSQKVMHKDLWLRLARERDYWRARGGAYQERLLKGYRER